jgi:S-adenosyl-L-methionine hydrolase (adenosine-forming)
MARRPIVTFTTDFGHNDHFVGTVKGVILNIVPEVEIVDISHAVQSFDIFEGALTIAQAYSYFPAETVHMVVVDPGVGTERRPLLVKTEKHIFVAPDNGVLSLVYGREERLHVREITADHYYLQPVSRTFHARDIFAPVAAYLAKGVADEKFKSVDGTTLKGVVLKVDRFGNLITNITPQDAPMLFQLDPLPFKVIVGKREITEIKSVYAEGAPGELFGILGSMGYLEIATNRGAAVQLVGSGKGSEVKVLLQGAAAAGNGK